MKLLSLMSRLSFSLLLSTNNAIRLHDFSATIPRCYEHVYIKSFLMAQFDFGIICLQIVLLWRMMEISLSVQYFCRIFEFCDLLKFVLYEILCE